MTTGSLSINAPSALQSAAGQHRAPKPPPLDKTAEALGLSTDDLKSQLKSGKTLNDIASTQGVSSDDLMKALKSDLAANKPANAPAPSDDQLTQMATSIAAGKGTTGTKGPHGHHGHHGPPPAPPADSDDSTADPLSTSVAIDTFA